MNQETINGCEETQGQFAEYQLLLGYLHQLMRYKYRIAIFAILMSGLVLGFSFLIEERFSAGAIVAINVSETPGGIQPSNYRGANTLGVIEYDFIIDGVQSNERERYLARIASFGFISDFILEHDLLPRLFAKEWDDSQGSWQAGFEPDMREAVKTFKSKLLYVRVDPKTDLLHVRMTTNDPRESAQLANQFVSSFNTYIRNLDAGELGSRRDYLEQRLKEVSNTEIHRSIYRLLEAQLAVESLINARDNYPLEMIQPATEPLYESFPRRKQWTALTLVGSMFLGLMGVVVIAVIKRIRNDLAAFERSKAVVPTAVSQPDIREPWIEE